MCILEMPTNVFAKFNGTEPVDLTVPLAVSISVEPKPSGNTI